jgi:nitronate monooxygenase
MKKFKIGNFEIPLPIIQGGMGIGVSRSGLSSAVANLGGVGVISAVGLGLYVTTDKVEGRKNFVEHQNEALRAEIRKARAKTSGVLGVNIMSVVNSFADLIKTAVDEKIDIIFVGAGLPLNLPSYLPAGSKTALVPIISSARAAQLICRKWKTQYDVLPDAFVIEGPHAGGHLGFSPEQLKEDKISLEQLLVEVLAAVKPIEEKYNQEIPLIIGGGIYTGQEVYKYLSMGASGVQMATRFITTVECDASDAFKNAFINAKKEDIRIIQSPVGMPGRAIWNDYLQKVADGEKHPVQCPYHCLKSCDFRTAPYCIVDALFNAVNGNMEKGFAFSGVNGYRATKIITVKETIDQIISEYKEAEKASV